MHEALVLWGKARPNSETGPRRHPLLWHLLDVAPDVAAVQRS